MPYSIIRGRVGTDVDVSPTTAYCPRYEDHNYCGHQKRSRNRGTHYGLGSAAAGCASGGASVVVVRYCGYGLGKATL